MREAISASKDVPDDFASSASYAHFLRARLAHDAGDHRQAVEELRLALVTDEGSPFLLTALAEEYARLSELDHAERELKRAIEARPTYEPAHVLLGRVLLEAQRFTRARFHLRRAVELKPKDPEPYLVLTQLGLELGHPDEAERVVNELAAQLPGDAVGYKRLGLALAEHSDLPRAERLLKKALEREATDVEVWMTLAQIYESTDRGEKALEADARALELDPDNQELLLAAGRLALKEGALPTAKAYFDRLLSLTDDAEVVVKVAFSYLAAQQPEGAVAVLDESRAQSQKEPRVSFYAGLLHEKLRRFDRAATAYGEVPRGSDLFDESRMRQASCWSVLGQHARALELFREGVAEKPDYVALYPAYARALERSGSPREAEGALVSALKAHPGPDVFEALAATYQRQGRLNDAVGVLVQAVGRYPADETLLFDLAASYEKRGEVDRSLDQMRQVLKVNPDNAAALNFIGYTLADRGRDIDFEEAERLVTRALELKPDSGAYMDSLGWLYYRRGQFARAVDALERASALSPGEPVIIEHLGDAYQGVLKKAEAVEAYRRALEALRASADPQEAKTLRQGLERKLKMLSSEARGQ